MALGADLCAHITPGNLDPDGRRGRDVSQRTQRSTVDHEAVVNVRRLQHGQRT
jgi:hypothetical protein